MSVCPKCKEIINFLNWNKPRNSFGTYDLQDGYEEDGNIDICQSDIIYSCPECLEELNFSEQEAKMFLIKKDELQEMIIEKSEMIEDENL